MKMTLKALILAAMCIIFALLINESKASSRSISKRDASPARLVNDFLIAKQLSDAFEREGLNPAIPLAQFLRENSEDLRTTGAVQQQQVLELISERNTGPSADYKDLLDDKEGDDVVEEVVVVVGGEAEVGVVVGGEAVAEGQAIASVEGTSTLAFGGGEDNLDE